MCLFSGCNNASSTPCVFTNGNEVLDYYNIDTVIYLPQARVTLTAVWQRQFVSGMAVPDSRLPVTSIVASKSVEFCVFLTHCKMQGFQLGGQYRSLIPLYFPNLTDL